MSCSGRQSHVIQVMCFDGEKNGITDTKISMEWTGKFSNPSEDMKPKYTLTSSFLRHSLIMQYSGGKSMQHSRVQTFLQKHMKLKCT